MSGLEQRTKDRDGAPVDCRGVTPRVAGVSLPATWLAQTAETAQTSKTSMKCASVRGRISPREPAQTAETSLRSPGQPIKMWWTDSGLLETAKTGNTEKRLESARFHKVLRVSPFPTARRLARTDMNSNPWCIDLHPNTNEPENAAGNTANTENPRTLSLVSCALKAPFLTRIIQGRRSHRPGPRELRECANLKKLDKMGIGAVL